MTDTWKMNMDKGMIVGAIFVDFKKAFDSISHNILSLKLQAIGLSGNLHEWLMDYLKDRFQYTVVNGHPSNLDEVKHGIPQGSLLGPRLYTIYVNDLPNAITSGDVFMYADDTTLYCVGKNFDQVCSQLNNILEQLLLWSTMNKLCIHPVKSEVMILSKTGFIGPVPPIYFGNNFINVVNHTTCLGLIIDNRLTWAMHVDHVKKSFAQKVGALKRMKKLPLKVLEEIYFKSIVPAVSYGTKAAPPQITEFLQNDLVAPDEVKFRDNTNWQLNLPCRANGSNKLSWEWRHNDVPIDPNKLKSDDNWQLLQDGTLLAKGLDISDNGTYQCFVTDTVTGVKTFSRKLSVAVTAVGQFNNEAPITRQVQLGRPFNFSCPPHGPSYGVSFTWTSKKELNIPCNSHPFARSERIAIDPSNGNLHIMYVTPQDITHIRDLGGIQCKISGANTFYSSGPLTLTTQQGATDPAEFSIPSFTPATSKSVEVAVEGRSKVLYCLATARPFPTITWKKSGKVLQNGIEVFQIPDALRGRLLNITKVDKNMHEGIYTCQARNNQTINGSAEVNIKLEVEVAPRWNVEPPRLQTFNISTNGNLSCDVYAEPKPLIKWFRDGSELVASSKVRQVNTDLLFSDLTLDEAGIYQCVAENKHGMIVSSTYVEVLAIAPSFQENGFGPFYLFHESEGRLKCDPEAAPRPNIFKWYKDDVEITPGVTYQIENDGTLVIINVQRSRDEGRYACYAENFLGDDLAESTAIVYKKTRIILAPKDRNVTEGSRVDLRCEAQVHDRLELHYLWRRDDTIIEYNQRFTWDRNVLTIADLTVEDAGIYTCLAYTPHPKRSEDSASATIDIADHIWITIAKFYSYQHSPAFP
ncbi:fibronectin type III domain-containing protein-like [Montipora capricornis]|uniref:fibronectin type III domain-containing protein-like n=1 Tax=Montipora capricornis TaxID=246305 RepID=UPI0035F113F8